MTKTEWIELRSKAEAIMEAHAKGADADAGFDGGEFSGPAHAEDEEEELAVLAAEYGITYHKLMADLADACAADAGPHGYIY